MVTRLAPADERTRTRDPYDVAHLGERRGEI
jgi:hypothetical protein